MLIFANISMSMSMSKLRDKIKIILVICGPSDISGPCLMFKDDLDPRVPKEVLMPIFPHVLER